MGVRDGTVLPALKREEGVGSQCQRIQVRLEPEKARDASARGSWTRSLWLVVPVAHGPSGMRQISDSDLQNYERVLVCCLKVLSCRYFVTAATGDSYTPTLTRRSTLECFWVNVKVKKHSQRPQAAA